MTIIDILFYAIFISQIFLISYYYPKKTYDRNMYVLRNYPEADYPKLYQHSLYADPSKALHKTIRRYLSTNIAIALFGLGLLIALPVNGYVPSGIKENKQIMFIMLFFMLQAVPHMLLGISTHNWHKGMQSAARKNARKADLSPRKLFDFISPIYIVLAVIAFIAWIVYYLYNKGFVTPWDWQSYVTILGMTGINLIFIGFGYMSLRGKKPDPHQAYKDQRQRIKTVIRVYVFASILMSLQLIVFDAINQYGWDMFEPIAMSLYFQIVIIFGIGQVLRMFKIQDIDFDVYKEDTWLV
jgi:magnesium-transporting ATPase (P-type)